MDGRCTLAIRPTAAPQHTALPLWDELFPAEQTRIVRLLVERVDLSSNGIEVRLRAEGLQTLVAELQRRQAA